MRKITIKSGKNKYGCKEGFEEIELVEGKIYTVVGKTGSGKSQLIEDIETLADGSSITSRVVETESENLVIAELSQNMNFILDLTVSEFVKTRALLLSEKFSNNYEIEFLKHVNNLCGEIVTPEDKLTQLSGGQSRAVMITDIALNKTADVVLIDEIENAGIDKVEALELLINNNKIVVVITHDPLLGLYGEKRVIMEDGGVKKVVERTQNEEILINRLYKEHRRNEELRIMLRAGLEVNYV